MIAYKVKGINNTTGKVSYLFSNDDRRRHFVVRRKYEAEEARYGVQNQLWDLEEDDIPEIDPSIYGDSNHLYWRRGKKDKETTWTIDTVFIKKENEDE